ncbi:MAG: nucleotidyltransferase domain-containing protein [Selenomonadales bacterium]|nr:nucleotidyltransferase domain-containing protein [Selenomonadales bacterium]
MRETIIQELRKIEQAENVKIIMAIESGSRAWGFASPDSDYDVRFIYVRREEDYLKLEGLRDVIEWRLDDTLDINGWDIQKALRLLYCSHAVLLEWCASPIVYLERDAFCELKRILPEYFSVKKTMFHYISMAEKNYRNYLKGETVRAKKYFYVLRPLLAAKWIADQKTAPPILFEDLVEAELDVSLRSEVERLLVMKLSMAEMDDVPRIQVLNDYIEKSIPELRKVAEESEGRRATWDTLNEVFLKLIQDAK